MRRLRNDDGLAALELGLIFTVLLAMLGLVGPLAYLYYENIQLSRAAGDVIRFATSRSDKIRDTSGIITAEDDLPSGPAMVAEAKLAYTGRGTAQLVSTALSTDTNCLTGQRLTIVLSTTVSVNAFTGLIINGPTKTLTATASSCEE